MPDHYADRDAKGRFSYRNRAWAARTEKRRFADDESLWAACVQYFEWVRDHPLYEDVLVTFRGVARHEPVPKVRAMTKAGLCRHLGVQRSTWRKWRLERADLARAVEDAESIIWSWNFEHAAVGMLDAPFIWRAVSQNSKADKACSRASSTARNNPCPAT